MRKFCILTVMAFALALAIPPADAAFLDGNGDEVLIGLDDDNTDNPAIQPPDAAANQSLNNTDVIDGEEGDDVLIGLLGNDVLRGGLGRDILIGGTEQGTQPNSDVMYGDEENDISIWAPGDGSDAFPGGSGNDALIFGVIDRDADNVPTLADVQEGPFRRTGVPTAEVTNSPGFCTLEEVQDPAFGFDFLVRFFVRATGNLAVTIRVIDVEQVFCTSEEGGAITFADLREEHPQFREVSLAEARAINRVVGQIIR